MRRKLYNWAHKLLMKRSNAIRIKVNAAQQYYNEQLELLYRDQPHDLEKARRRTNKLMDAAKTWNDMIARVDAALNRIKHGQPT